MQLVSAVNGLKIDVLGPLDVKELREGNSGMTWETKMVGSKFSGANIKDGKIYGNNDEEESSSAAASEIDRARARMAAREAEESREQKAAIAAKNAANTINKKLESFAKQDADLDLAQGRVASAAEKSEKTEQDNIAPEVRRQRGRPKKAA